MIRNHVAARDQLRRAGVSLASSACIPRSSRAGLGDRFERQLSCSARSTHQGPTEVAPLLVSVLQSVHYSLTSAYDIASLVWEPSSLAARRRLICNARPSLGYGTLCRGADGHCTAARLTTPRPKRALLKLMLTPKVTACSR